MKANEMPERIYIFDYNDAMVTPIEGDTMYVREDAFIEKAEEFIYSALNDGIMDTCNIEDFLRLFKNYMKGEKV
jgi:aminoglycoside/choline kinase family phosphotransferase